jgi:hypothetical protein
LRRKESSACNPGYADPEQQPHEIRALTLDGREILLHLCIVDNAYCTQYPTKVKLPIVHLWLSPHANVRHPPTHTT